MCPANSQGLGWLLINYSRDLHHKIPLVRSGGQIIFTFTMHDDRGVQVVGGGARAHIETHDAQDIAFALATPTLVIVPCRSLWL